MALITSPIDGSPMRQINRFGIEIDVCPTSGGIWLDRGELEKLIALLKEEAGNDHQPAGMQYHSAKSIDYGDQRHRHHDSHGHRHGSHHKSKMSRVMDIFDF